MAIRAVRGATTVPENDKDEIIAASQEMLREIIEKNDIDTADMVDITFTVTKDLTKVFPAASVRRMGITNVPLLDMAAPDIEGALEKCIRVIVRFNTDKTNDDIYPVYLRGAKALRPDIIAKQRGETK